MVPCMPPAITNRISDAEQEHIGAALRTIRELRELTISELANAMLISYAYLFNIEAGRKRLTPELAERAIVALNINPRALVRRDLFAAELVSA